jgi:hypothetical protein
MPRASLWKATSPLLQASVYLLVVWEKNVLRATPISLNKWFEGYLRFRTIIAAVWLCFPGESSFEIWPIFPISRGSFVYAR